MKRKLVVCLAVLLSIIYSPFIKSEALAQDFNNIFLESTLSANAEHYNGWYEYYRPLSALVDGNTYVGEGYSGNMLAAPYGDNGLSFVNFKIKTPAFMNKIVIYFAGSSVASGNAVTDYAIDVKLQDGSWKRVSEKHNDGYTNWDAYVETFIFEKILADEVRITMKNGKGQSYAGIYEVEAFFDASVSRNDFTKNESYDCTENAIPIPENKNILCGLVPETGTYDDWYAVNRPLSSLTDGNTYYGVGYNLGETAAVPFSSDGLAYFSIPFSNVREINHVRLSLPGTSAVEMQNQPRDFVIDVKLQNGNWERVAKKSISKYENWDAFLIDLYFEKVYATELRITFSNKAGQSFAVLYEMEAYYNNCLTAESYNSFDALADFEMESYKPFEVNDDLPTLGLCGDESKMSYNGGSILLNGSGKEYITFGNLYLSDFELNLSVESLTSQIYIDIFETKCVGSCENRIELKNNEVYFKGLKLGDYNGNISDILVRAYNSQLNILLENKGEVVFEKAVSIDSQAKGNLYISSNSKVVFNNLSILELDVNDNKYQPLIYKMGDIDCDGDINTNDLVFIRKKLLYNEQTVYTDVNADNKTNILDLIRIKKEIAGITDKKIYVSNYGKDSNDGTKLQPLNTLSKALQTVSDTGIIEVIGTNYIDTSFKWEKHNKNITITGDTLDFTKMNGTNLVLEDSVTFDDITVNFDDNDYLFANGNKLVINENVVLCGVIRLYGGGIKDSVINGDTDIKVLSGTYEGIYGGSNNGTVNGNTNVYVGGNVNETITIKHVEKYFVYGGGVGGTVTGDTNVIFTDNAKAEVVVGGYNGWSDGNIGGKTNVLISGGKIMGVYGGNYFGYNWEQFDKNKVTEIDSTNVTITSGEIQQVFGGNANAFLTGDVNINVLGGKISRRIYGGCYNNLGWNYTSSCYVKGEINLKISGNADISLDYDDLDCGIFGISRYKTKNSDEISKIIFEDEIGYQKYFSKIGPSSSDSYMKQNLPSKYYDEIIKNY